jgi:hypothetical protein
MVQRWQCRYSSSEMLYMELRGRDVVTYLDHSPQRPDRWSFDEVLSGKHDAEIAQLFGAQAPADVKAAIGAALNPSPVLSKQQLRQPRRREDRSRQKG